jgi:hypothetical protein
MMDPGDIETRPPYEGESLYGYVADITGLNQLGRVALIAGPADRIHGHRPQLATTGWDDLPALAELLEVDVAELQLRSYPLLAEDPGRRAFFGTSVFRNDVRTRVRFFSPAALAAKPFHRAMWELRIPFDADTGEILVSSCALCGQTQRWRHSAGVAFCDKCGESLDQGAERIDEDLLPDLKLAVGLTHSDPARRTASIALLPNEIAELGPALAFELLLRLIPVAEPACKWTPADRIWRNDPHDIAKGMHEAWRILAGWPEAMKERISCAIATAERRYSDGNHGATLGFLALRNAEYLPPVLRDIIQRLHELIDTTGTYGADLLNQTMSCTEVSKALGLRSGKAVALRRDRILRTIGVARGNELLALFDRQEALDIAQAVQLRWELSRAKAILGLPYYAIEQLSALGRLPLLKHAFCMARFAGPLTTKAAFNRLTTQLETVRTHSLEDAKPIFVMMQMVGGRLKPWDAVIEAMLDRKLPYTLDKGEKPLFSRVRVRREDLLHHLHAPITRNGAATPLARRIDPEFHFLDRMAKCDAAEVLNLTPNQGANFLRDYPATGQPAMLISDVEMIAQQFFTRAEIATRLDIPHQRVPYAARALGIERCGAGYSRSEEARLITKLTENMTKRADNVVDDTGGKSRAC